MEHYRLPSEAQWEYAARAGDAVGAPSQERQSTAETTGEKVGDENSDDRTTPVEESAGNAWDLHAMIGGVLEWVQDCYQEDYAGAPTDGSAWLNGDCSRRVLRGGPVRRDSAAVHASTRHWHVATFRFGLRGFRVARDD